MTAPKRTPDAGAADVAAGFPNIPPLGAPEVAGVLPPPKRPPPPALDAGCEVAAGCPKRPPDAGFAPPNIPPAAGWLAGVAEAFPPDVFDVPPNNPPVAPDGAVVALPNIGLLSPAEEAGGFPAGVEGVAPKRPPVPPGLFPPKIPPACDVAGGVFEPCVPNEKADVVAGAAGAALVLGWPKMEGAAAPVVAGIGLAPPLLKNPAAGFGAESLEPAAAFPKLNPPLAGLLGLLLPNKLLLPEPVPKRPPDAGGFDILQTRPVFSDDRNQHSDENAVGSMAALQDTGWLAGLSDGGGVAAGREVVAASRVSAQARRARHSPSHNKATEAVAR